MMDSYRLSRHIIRYKPGRGAIVGYLFDYVGKGDKPPEGWLFCDGQALPRTEFAELYAVIGETYRKKVKNPNRKWYQFRKPKLVDEDLDGKFRLPDLRGKIL